MLSGFATRSATAALAEKNRAIAYNETGPQGLYVSQVGFGCYRVSAGVQTHSKALTLALSRGVNLIDTSVNYADGGSEILVGQVLQNLIEAGSLDRQQVVVVSKVGYLQGQNLELSREKTAAGSQFKELVRYNKDLEHCIHPEFIADQLTRSLERLGLETLDFYLLHNPEYYLEWALKEGTPAEEAHREYYRRIQAAFEHLETEVTKGRIRAYGISSNTFPATGKDPERTALDKIREIASSLSKEHHFGMIQMPLNLLEKGAILEKNQSNGTSVLEFARKKKIGVLINRPLNAFNGNRLVRLVDIPMKNRQEYSEIIRKIRAVIKSETKLWRTILPDCNFIPEGTRIRIKEQLSVGDTLKHYSKNFGSYERWRQTKNSSFLPRVNGVFNYLEQYSGQNKSLIPWIRDHTACLEDAFGAVASIYISDAARQVEPIKRAVSAADPDWAGEGFLSQKAVRAIRTTAGVTSVLVGMRRTEYVNDILEELERPVPVKERQRSWEKLL